MWHYESPVDTEHRKDLEDFIRRESSSVTHLCIIGATGVDTFVDRTSPFYEAVKNASHVEVILANPDKESHFIKDRVRKLALCDKNINLQSYISDINKSIDYLKTIATRDKTVEIYTYSSDIQWKIIIFGEYLLLQHYGDKHVRDTPIYLFAKSNRQPARGLHKAMLCEYGITKASSKRV